MMKLATEHQEQSALIQWARMHKHSGVRMLYAIPNAAKRSVRLAAMMKSEGMMAGVPDLFLPYPVEPYHGLYIEMKRRKGGKVSDNQRSVID